MEALLRENEQFDQFFEYDNSDSEDSVSSKNVKLPTMGRPKIYTDDELKEKKRLYRRHYNNKRRYRKNEILNFGMCTFNKILCYVLI